ncbi:MAG: RNA polymerase sporulation sigma factor SigE [Lachnospiraceae bacterium]|nr:RNA polymerase sporulation sigma factor SigE [Lachnospiraceae bacterium]
MQVEIYLDILFIIHLVLNVYLLYLLQRIMLLQASFGRISGGALAGAIIGSCPYILGVGTLGKLAFMVLSFLGMIRIAFGHHSRKGFAQMIKQMSLLTLILGGGIIVLRPIFLYVGLGTASCAIAGGALCLLIAVRYLREEMVDEELGVTLFWGGNRLQLPGLLDSGNSLIEPISDKPVCVIGACYARMLFRDGKPKGGRVIPYTSVGNRRGIMEGYPIPMMYFEKKGIYYKFFNVYVAISEEITEESEFGMILHPEIFQQSKKSAWRGLNMVWKVVMPGMARWKVSYRDNGVFRKKRGEIHYIGGSEVLPPPLNQAEENQILQDLGTEYEGEAKAILIERNLRLVVYIAKKFDNTGVGVEDLISIGTIGLIKSINTYKPDKNIKLATYASRCIENEILMYLRKNNKTRMEVSIDEPLNVDWDGNELLLSDILGTEEDTTYRGIENEVERSVLKKAIEKLSDREQTIIKLRFGLCDAEEREMTQKEVADLLGISQSYISRLEKKIMKRLKREMISIN